MTDNTPEISQEAARAMLAALREADILIEEIIMEVRGLAALPPGVFMAQHRISTAIAQAEGRA